MADDKKIRVGIDNSAFEAYESKMRQSSENLARGMIQSSRSYTTSAKETLSTIEEQIRAIEKRNTLDREFREREVLSARDSGSITSQQAKSRIGAIGQESKEDKLQTQLLRELIDTVKTTSRQEIREDRVGVEKRIQTSKTVGVLNPQMDAFDSLKESIQQQYLSELGGEEASQRGFTGEGFQKYGMLPVEFAGAKNMLGIASGAANTAGGALSKMGGAGGIMGALAALTVGRLISTLGGSAETLEGSLGDWSRLGGGSVRDYDPSGFNVRNLARHGMSISDFVTNRSNLEIEAKTNDFGESVSNLMYLSGGTMLSDQDVSGMVGLRRFGGGTVSGTASHFENYLKQTGQNSSVLPEIIQQFTSEARNMVSQTGHVNTANLASTFTTVGAQTGFQGDLLGQSMSTLDRGMRRSTNPVTQALQFRAAKGVAGEGATLWDIEKVMADPLANPEYIQEMLTSLKSISGGGQSYERAISNVLRVNPNLAGKYAKIDLDKTLTSEQINVMNEEKVSYAGKDAETVGAAKQGGKFLEGGREKIAFERAQEISEAMIKMVDKLNEWVDKGTLATDKVKEVLLESQKLSARRNELAEEAAVEMTKNTTLQLVLSAILKQPTGMGIIQ